jgi:hypothetical protein
MGKGELETMKIQAPILITGCARSGTSMTAGALYQCGAWGGETSPPNRYNKKGMYENNEIRNQVVKPFLRKFGYDPLGQFPLPNIKHLLSLPESLSEELRRDVLRILKRQGLQNQAWFYKGAKMCLMWPLWHKAFPDAQWIIVRRETEDIVSSCLRTSFMKAHKKRSGWIKWVGEHEARFEEMIANKLNVREVWPQRMIRGEFSEIQTVVNALGLNWKEKAVVDFVDPGLWRGWKSRRRDEACQG